MVNNRINENKFWNPNFQSMNNNNKKWLLPCDDNFNRSRIIAFGSRSNEKKIFFFAFWIKKNLKRIRPVFSHQWNQRPERLFIFDYRKKRIEWNWNWKLIKKILKFKFKVFLCVCVCVRSCIWTLSYHNFYFMSNNGKKWGKNGEKKNFVNFIDTILLRTEFFFLFVVPSC